MFNKANAPSTMVFLDRSIHKNALRIELRYYNIYIIYHCHFYSWGGCIVALVLEDRVEEYVNKMKREFYLAHNKKVDNWDSVIFSSNPEGGANIFSY